MKLRKIVNGGAATCKPNTRRSNIQANSVFIPFLPIDVYAKANQLLNNIHLQLEAAMEGSKSKTAAVSAPFESKDVVIQIILAPIYLSNSTMIQAPIEHKEASTKTFSTESPLPSHFKHKEQRNTAQQNLTFAEAIREGKDPRLSFCAQ
ncbi:hypothetical protein AVEN_163676-1 [Araneus ventricosus]|uniref:Uncharacterized protein n=1 Tax=Araneus ventricosus TaxID=182803 RepID=A0A4Y2LX86_ARAVE|nr:hypothetical protein AVEN_163676-1 [Araneus ventricosus]